LDALQERKFLRKIAAAMQFGKLAVGGGQLMCAPAKSRAITSERHAAPGSHAYAALPLVLAWWLGPVR